MSLKDTIQLAGTVAFTLGVFIGGMGYLYSLFRKGSTQEKTELVGTAGQLTDFWKDQVAGYKDIVATLTEKVRLLTGELGEVRGQLNAEKAQNKNLEAIFQNRNPEMEEFMKYMVQATKDQAESHKQIVAVLNDIHVLAIEEKNKTMKVTATVQKLEPNQQIPGRRAEDR